jgi:ribonuclease J
MLMRPRFFIPIHGEYRMLKTHVKLAQDTGVKPENTFILDNGDVLALTKTTAKLDGKVQTADVYVDGTAIGEVGTHVIKDRRELSEDGLLSVVMTINQERQEVICVPSIVSKGFIFMKDNNLMLKDLQELALDVTDKYLTGGKKLNISGLKNDLQKSLSKYIHQKTSRKPMIMPVIMVL